MANPVAGILLAAGGSTRLGRPKQLLPFRGRTLLRHAAETALGSGCDSVHVVLGSALERTRRALDGLQVQVVPNPHWQEGMASSIRRGLQAALSAGDVGGALLMLADQPFVTAEHLGEMIELFRRGRAPIIAARYDGHPGAPVLFDRALLPALLGLEGQQGARHLVAARPHDTFLFDLPEAAADIDLETDLRHLG